MIRLLIAASIVLAAGCATQDDPPPSVVDANAQPLIRVSPKGFEACVGRTRPGPSKDLVEVELATSAEGYVTEAKVLRSTDACFDPYVLEAVRQWRYPPRLIDGELAARTGVKAVVIFNVAKDDGQEPVGTSASDASE